jgi:hypothetical protein
MARVVTQSANPAVEREQLRRDLLKMIVKSEATRRDQPKADGK